MNVKGKYHMFVMYKNADNDDFWIKDCNELEDWLAILAGDPDILSLRYVIVRNGERVTIK